MSNERFVDLTIEDGSVTLSGTKLHRPHGVDVKSWRSLWDATRKALERRGSMRAVNEKLSGSSMDDFRRLANAQ